jgi:hypothetical protein
MGRIRAGRPFPLGAHLEDNVSSDPVAFTLPAGGNTYGLASRSFTLFELTYSIFPTMDAKQA